LKYGFPYYHLGPETIILGKDHCWGFRGLEWGEKVERVEEVERVELDAEFDSLRVSGCATSFDQGGDAYDPKVRNEVPEDGVTSL